MTTGDPRRRTIQLTEPIDLARTLAPIGHGRGDPTFRIGPDGVWWALRQSAGPATLRLRRSGGEVQAEAWGPGADEALESADAIIGLDDEVDAFVPRHPVLADLQRRLRGVRLPRTGQVWAALLPAICEQKVTGLEASRSYRSIVRRWGEPAPGPGDRWLPPEPSRLAGVGYFALHPLGVERRRADTIRRAAAAAARVERASPERGRQLLAAIPGIGPWTVAEVARIAWGDPDAISLGDYHIPSLVAWALAGERRADDARMLELLAPYAGQRGRVQRLLELSGLMPPRRGPRMAPRRIHAQ